MGKRERSESPERGEVGRVISIDEYGEWRTVPGFSPSKFIVSSKGYHRVRTGPASYLRPPSLACQGPNGYRVVGIDGKQYSIARLVCTAWHGPCPEGHSCDHIAKYGDKMKERSDNRAENLRWLSLPGQAKNQGPRAPKRSGKAILVRHTDWPANTPSFQFASAHAANAALGIQNLSSVANGKRADGKIHSCVGGVWTAAWAPPAEEQGDLPDEEWVDWDESLKISSFGRVQMKRSNSQNWGDRFTPQPCDGEVYAKVKGNNTFHIMVFKAFGGTLLPGETVDHIDRDTSNNARSNLRAATKKQQLLNRSRKPSSQREMSLKNAVEAKPLDGHEWERFDSQAEAARILAERTGVRFDSGNVSAVVRGKQTHKKGWVFRACA